MQIQADGYSCLVFRQFVACSAWACGFVNNIRADISILLVAGMATPPMRAVDFCRVWWMATGYSSLSSLDSPWIVYLNTCSR